MPTTVPSGQVTFLLPIKTQLLLNWWLRSSERPLPPHPSKVKGPLFPSTKKSMPQGLLLLLTMVVKPEHTSGVPLVLLYKYHRVSHDDFCK